MIIEEKRKKLAYDHMFKEANMLRANTTFTLILTEIIERYSNNGKICNKHARESIIGRMKEPSLKENERIQ